MSSSIVITVPCYNEAARLPGQELLRMLLDERFGLVLVDDGSKDDTLAVLRELAAAAPERIRVLALEQNRGKAEAVRRGMLLGAESGASIVGYLDADLATPVSEMQRLCEVLLTSGTDAVIGSRVAYLGANIQRSALRHYLGRVFATGAALTLGKAIYDTQCGAKAFRVKSALMSALTEPFSSRWAFDVELLGRLMVEGATIREEPLRQWIDVAGSKLRPGSMLKAAADLALIRRQLRRRRTH